MSLENTDFDMYAGDTQNLRVSAIEEDGTVIDLTGATVRWVAVRGRTIVIDKTTSNGGITIEDAVNGKCIVHISPIDTENLLGSLPHQAVLTDAFGNVSTVVRGTIKVIISYI